MIDIKETFLKLTRKRYPHGDEDAVIELLPEYKFEKDEIGNYYIIIKKEDGTFSNSMFTSHLDTINRGSGYGVTTWSNGVRTTTYNEKDDKSVTHVFKGDMIETDGKSNLGADDKAGVVIMLNMITENVPGLYYFFIGEESGCIGSSALSRRYEELVEAGTLPKVNKCVAFDRRGYDSVITRQGGSKCSSDKFADELAKRLNEYGFWFKGDSGGVYTDSAEFTDVVQECSNLSVGYFSEHTTTERQDIEFLELLSIVVTKIDWETLPIEREVDKVYTGKKSRTTTTTTTPSSYVGNRYSMYDDDEDYNYYNEYSTKALPAKTESKKDVIDYDMDEFDKWYHKQKLAGWQVGVEED